MSPDRTNISITPMHKLNAQDIVTEARTWLGTRWVHQGRSRAGIDCAGLLIRVSNDLGLKVADKQGYKRTPDGLSFLDHIRTQSDFVATPEPGAIAIFRERHLPCHVGIFSERHGATYFIHSYMNLGRVIEEPFAHHWVSNLVEVRRFQGVAY